MSEKFSAIVLMGFLVGMLVVGMATNSDFWGHVIAQMGYGSGQIVVVKLPPNPFTPAPVDVAPEQSQPSAQQHSSSPVVRAASLQ